MHVLFTRINRKYRYHDITFIRMFFGLHMSKKIVVIITAAKQNTQIYQYTHKI